MEARIICTDCKHRKQTIVEFVNTWIHGSKKATNALMYHGSSIILDDDIDTLYDGFVTLVYKFISKVKRSLVKKIMSMQLDLNSISDIIKQKGDMFWTVCDYDEVNIQVAFILHNLVARVIDTIEMIHYSMCWSYFDIVTASTNIVTLGGGPCIESYLIALFCKKRFNKDFSLTSIDIANWDFEYLRNINWINRNYTEEDYSLFTIAFNVDYSCRINPDSLGNNVIFSYERSRSQSYVNKFVPFTYKDKRMGVYINMLTYLNKIKNMSRNINIKYFDSDNVHEVEEEYEDCDCTHVKHITCKIDIIRHDLSFMAKCSDDSYDEMVEKYMNYHESKISCGDCGFDYYRNMRREDLVYCSNYYCSFSCSNRKYHYLPNGRLYQHLACIGYNLKVKNDIQLFVFIKEIKRLNFLNGIHNDTETPVGFRNRIFGYFKKNVNNSSTDGALVGTLRWDRNSSKDLKVSQIYETTLDKLNKLSESQLHASEKDDDEYELLEKPD